MPYQYSFLATIFCKWLKWHLPILLKESKRAGNIHKTCILCNQIIFTESMYKDHGEKK